MTMDAPMCWSRVETPEAIATLEASHSEGPGTFEGHTNLYRTCAVGQRAYQVSSATWMKLNSILVGGRGHYLNSRIELGSGVLDLMRTHCDRVEQSADGLKPPACRPVR